MKKLYLISELLALKPGDEVRTYYKGEYIDRDITKLHFIDSDGIIYFKNGYDFPTQDCSVETIYAIQDTGDYVFKVYKL